MKITKTSNSIFIIISSLCLSQSFAQEETGWDESPEGPPSYFENPVPAYTSGAQFEGTRKLRRIYPDIEPSSQEEVETGKYLLRHTQSSQQYNETAANCSEAEVDAYWNFLAEIGGLYKGESIEDMYRYNNGDEWNGIPFWAGPNLTDETAVTKPDCLNPYPFDSVFIDGASNTYFDFLKDNTTIKDIYIGFHQSTEVDLTGFDDAHALRNVYLNIPFVTEISIFNQPGVGVDDLLSSDGGEVPSFSDPNAGLMIAFTDNDNVEKIHALENFNDNRYTYPINFISVNANPNLTSFEGFNSVKNINKMQFKKTPPELVVSGFKNLENLLSLEINKASLESLSSVIQGLNIHSSIILHNLQGEYNDFKLFDSVTSLSHNLEITEVNTDIIDGFTELNRVNEIWIEDVPLTNITGMRPSVINDIVLRNTQLTNLDVLENVSALNGDDIIEEQYGYALSRGTIIANNPNLTDITGLRNIASTSLPIFIDYSAATAANYTSRPAMNSPFCQGILSGDVKIADFNTYGDDFWSINYQQQSNTSLLVSRLCASD